MSTELSWGYHFRTNPLIKGLKHISFKEANDVGMPVKKELYYTIRPYTSCEKAAYWLGRIVRFTLSIPGAIIDLALQFFQSVGTTIEILAVTLEKCIRKCSTGETYSYYMYSKCGLTVLFRKIRENTTLNEINNLGMDLNILEAPLENSFARSYRNFLLETLGF